MTNLASQFYHPGETRLQQSVGGRDKVEAISRVLMKDHLIGQHRDFYAGLEYLFLSAVDNSGNLRAIMVAGTQEFLSTPNEQVLRINSKTSDVAVQRGDLKLGAMVGGVGMDLSNRRRNRMHGPIETVCETHIDIRVTQSYGNCPKYINVRNLTTQFSPTEPHISANRAGLNDVDRASIRAADIFLIASYYNAGLHDPFEGADMSHRGGNPGFVRVAGDTLIIPDYFGNDLFNTLGNKSHHSTAVCGFRDERHATSLRHRPSSYRTGSFDRISKSTAIAGSNHDWRDLHDQRDPAAVGLARAVALQPRPFL